MSCMHELLYPYMSTPSLYASYNSNVAILHRTLQVMLHVQFLDPLPWNVGAWCDHSRDAKGWKNP